MSTPNNSNLILSARSDLLNKLGWSSEDIALAVPIPGATTTTGDRLATVPQVALSTIDGCDLYDRTYPPRVPVVDGLIYRGDCVVIAGRPKSGKSWLAFQTAESIDIGKTLLGKATTRAKVLYLALEDGERRIYERMRIRNWRPKATTFAFGCLPFDDGEGISQVRNAGEFFDVVIIDTLIATLTSATNESDNTAMAEIMNALAGWAHDTAKTVVIVHHTGKGASEDPFESIRGASSIRGAYDTGIVLQRKAKEAEAILHVESRDIDAPDMSIRFDAAKGWSYEGDGAQYENLQAGRKVVKALMELGDWQSKEDLAGHMGVTPNAAYQSLRAAERARLVVRKDDPSADGRKPRDLWALADVSGPSHN